MLVLVLEFMKAGRGQDEELVFPYEDHGAVSQAHCFPWAEAEVSPTGGADVLDVEACAACLVDGAVAGLEMTAGDSRVLMKGGGGEEKRRERQVRREGEGAQTAEKGVLE